MGHTCALTPHAMPVNKINTHFKSLKRTTSQGKFERSKSHGEAGLLPQLPHYRGNGSEAGGTMPGVTEPAFPPSGWVAAVNESSCALQHCRGPSQGPGSRGKDCSCGNFSRDTDNLSPTQQRLRKDNGGTKFSQGGSGQHPSMAVSAFTVPDYIG